VPPIAPRLCSGTAVGAAGELSQAVVVPTAWLYRVDDAASPGPAAPSAGAAMPLATRPLQRGQASSGDRPMHGDMELDDPGHPDLTAPVATNSHAPSTTIAARHLTVRRDM
jgi:hypothetical protein